MGEQQIRRNTCNAPLGSKPWHLNADQYDAIRCRCDLPKKHDGRCECEHIRSGDDRE